jgi:hypothetical protein
VVVVREERCGVLHATRARTWYAVSGLSNTHTGLATTWR